MNKCTRLIFFSYFIALCLTMVSVKFYASGSPLQLYKEKGYGGINPLSRRYVAAAETIKNNVKTNQKISYNNRLTDEERERLKLASQYYSSLKEHKHDRPTIYYMKTANDQNTCAGTSLDIDFANLIRKVVYWPMDQKKPELDQDFQHCWNMGTYFPTRHLTMDAIPILSAKITLNQSTIDDTFRLYTSHNNHVHSVTNIVLAMHITDDIDDKNNSIDSLKGVTSFIKKLNAAVCQQARNNKSKGLTVYRGATISPIGLCIMKVKKKFFLPTFVSASSSEEACYWDPNIHNVKLAIDLSECWDKAAVIENHQTEYPEEREVTLSCNNLYEYQRKEYSEANETLYVYLTVKNSDGYEPKELDFIRDYENYSCSSCTDLNSWMSKRGEASRTSQMSSFLLQNNFDILYENFNNHFTITTTKSKNIDKTTNTSDISIKYGDIPEEKVEQYNNNNDCINKSSKYDRHKYPFYAIIFISGIVIIVLNLFLRGK